MRTQRRIGWVATYTLLMLATSCGRQTSRRVRAETAAGNSAFVNENATPFVTALSTQPANLVPGDVAVEKSLTSRDPQAAVAAADLHLTATNAAPASTAIQGDVALRKDQIFGRTFLYGADLQYSSGADADLSLIPQAMAMGEVPAFFRRLGPTLQLVADQSRLFESDINHPEVLLNEYQIVAEDDQTLTVVFKSTGAALNELVNGKGSALPKQTWLRSISVDGDYLLQETGMLLPDGSVETFLESVFPRDTLVPSHYQGLEANPDTQPLAARYRFLGAEKVFVPRTKEGTTVREQTAFAQRFNIEGGRTIDWYVTPNVPDKFLPAIKSGIEGWNRYFRAQVGRDVMRFRGKLPEGVKVGDPRYNIVNWDSVAQAGAAYETQASDPLTGLQSHSLIYLPFAWYNIGVGYWKKQVTDPSAAAQTMLNALEPKSPEVLFGAGHKIISCLRPVDEVAPAPELAFATNALVTPNVQTGATVDEFGMRLVASVLFHEVGHSLGLAHNFKGSLAFDGDEPVNAANPATWSIMDYNYYQLEQDAFNKIGESDGPSFEYDRQIISQLYDAGKDVKDNDPVIPACADEEADSKTGGVDPFCVRYDSERDPSLAVQHAYNDIVAASGAHGAVNKTLSEALIAVKPLVAAKLKASTITDSAALTDATKALVGQVSDLISFYVNSGNQSLRLNLDSASKALREWRDDADDLPSVFKKPDEAAFRKRYLSILKSALAMRALPEEPAKALANLEATVEQTLKSSAVLSGATATERAASAEKLSKAFDAAIDAKIGASLSSLRKTVYGDLAYDAASPFAVRLAPGGDVVSIEDFAVTALKSGVTLGLDASETTANDVEREAAAKALDTYKTDDSEADALASVRADLKSLLAKGEREGDQRLSDEARTLQTDLQ